MKICWCILSCWYSNSKLILSSQQTATKTIGIKYTSKYTWDRNCVDWLLLGEWYYRGIGGDTWVYCIITPPVAPLCMICNGKTYLYLKIQSNCQQYITKHNTVYMSTLLSNIERLNK